MIKKHIINYTEYTLLVILFLVSLVHYLGLLDMQMYFSGILLFLTCIYISFLWKENTGDERDEFIKAKTDRYLYLFINILISLYILVGIFIHLDISTPLLFLGIITLAKIIISKYLQVKN